VNERAYLHQQSRLRHRSEVQCRQIDIVVAKQACSFPIISHVRYFQFSFAFSAVEKSDGSSLLYSIRSQLSATELDYIRIEGYTARLYAAKDSYSTCSAPSESVEYLCPAVFRSGRLPSSQHNIWSSAMRRQCVIVFVVLPLMLLMSISIVMYSELDPHLLFVRSFPGRRTEVITTVSQISQFIVCHEYGTESSLIYTCHLSKF
jgi:hypothetical protein